MHTPIAASLAPKPVKLTVRFLHAVQSITSELRAPKGCGHLKDLVALQNDVGGLELGLAVQDDARSLLARHLFNAHIQSMGWLGTHGNLQQQHRASHGRHCSAEARPHLVAPVAVVGMLPVDASIAHDDARHPDPPTPAQDASSAPCMATCRAWRGAHSRHILCGRPVGGGERRWSTCRCRRGALGCWSPGGQRAPRCCCCCCCRHGSRLAAAGHAAGRPGAPQGRPPLGAADRLRALGVPAGLVLAAPQHR